MNLEPRTLELIMPGPTKSLRPKMRPSALDLESSKRPPKPKVIGAGISRATPDKGSTSRMIGNRPGSDGTSGIDPKDNYSPEDYDRLMDSYEGKTQKFRDGGSVRGCKSSQMSGKGFSGSY